MNWYKAGGLIWTACGACWLVIGIQFDMPEAYLCGLSCCVASWAFHRMGGEL